MANPYIGEIRMFGGNFAPQGWAFCQGQLLAIADNDALFALLGTTYGGDGQTTFALPDLRGRIPIHQGNGYLLAEQGGTETETLTAQQIPFHNHSAVALSDHANTKSPKNALPARADEPTYAQPGDLVAMNPQAVSAVGGNQPHENLQPYLCVNFIISLFGIFPSQN